MASHSQQVTTSYRQRYQGYPNVNPQAFGVPSIDPHTAARWANLPRRPIGQPVRVHDQACGSGTESTQVPAITPDSDHGTIKSDISDLDENPVVYIDLPDDNESGIVERREENSINQNKTDDLDEHVVYIDMPESSGSEVCERREECEEGPSASVVQETILFDQFKNRRIEIAPASNESESDDESSIGIPSNRIPPPRPLPPNTLNINRGQDSGSQTNGPTPPSYLSQEEYLHNQISPEDDFRLSPLPVSRFPDPPPAYSEIDETPVPVTTPTGDTSSAGEQRTTVIVNTPVGNSNRKYMACKHCGIMVHSLVVKQISFLTHVLAISMMFVGLFPIAILVYCFGYFKSKQHYCPNCAKMMTSEDPFKLCC